MKLAHMTWPQVESYLKNSRALIVPIGSTEQHGPTGLIGTDYLTAQGIAEAIGTKLGVIVAPPIVFGMALHHMAFPGTVALKPSTLLQYTLEVLACFKKHGFRQFFFVNGHGGNGPSLMAAFSEFKSDEDESHIELFNWWKMPEIEAYEKEHFGDQSGFHATIGEVSVTQYLHPEAFETIPKKEFPIEHPEHTWPLSPSEFRRVFPDGRMSSNPGLATAEHGKLIFELAVSGIAQRVTKALTPNS